MIFPDEPHELVNDIAVHIGAISMLRDLRELGFVVELDEDGELVVEPYDDLPEDTQELIGAFEPDIVLLLRMGGETIHSRIPRTRAARV